MHPQEMELARFNRMSDMSCAYGSKTSPKAKAGAGKARAGGEEAAIGLLGAESLVRDLESAMGDDFGAVGTTGGGESSTGFGDFSACLGSPGGDLRADEWPSSSPSTDPLASAPISGGGGVPGALSEAESQDLLDFLN